MPKKKRSVGRPKGTTGLTRAMRTVASKDNILMTHVSDTVMEAFDVLKEVMRDDDSASTVRLSAAKAIIDLHKTHVKEAAKVKNSTKQQVQERRETLEKINVEAGVDSPTEPLMTLTDTFPQ